MQHVLLPLNQLVCPIRIEVPHESKLPICETLLDLYQQHLHLGSREMVVDLLLHSDINRPHPSGLMEEGEEHHYSSLQILHLVMMKRTKKLMKRIQKHYAKVDFDYLPYRILMEKGKKRGE